MQIGQSCFRLRSKLLLLGNRRHAFHVSAYRRAAANKGEDAATEVSRTRNIGIIAHIDAVFDLDRQMIWTELIVLKGKDYHY